MPVSLFGQPADMDEINAIAARHGLAVIEDAAHAHGSAYQGFKCGAWGDMASFSFQSTKNLTSGEGGIITTDDDDLAARCRSIHNCGRVEGGAWYEHHVMSGNYRLGEFAGAILNCQLDRLDEQTDRRDANGRYLDEQLSKIPGITPQRRGKDANRHAQHLYLFRYDAAAFEGVPRQTFVEAMNAEGIPLSTGYVLPLYRQPLFADRNFAPYVVGDVDYGKLHLPNVEAICSAEGAWLGQNVLLGSRDDMDDVVAAMHKIYERRQSLARGAPARIAVGSGADSGAGAAQP
jgi:dTDP-4-amino-4,6-dideoxygalactose transaminase